MTRENMVDIGSKEIRGITGKLILGFAVGYSSILLSIVGIYFTTKNNFQRLEDRMATETSSQEFREGWVDRQISTITVKQESIQNQVNLQRIEIERIKAQLQIK